LPASFQDRKQFSHGGFGFGKSPHLRIFPWSECHFPIASPPKPPIKVVVERDSNAGSRIFYHCPYTEDAMVS